VPAGRTRLSCQAAPDPANITRTRIRAVLAGDDGRPVPGQTLTFDLPQPLFPTDPNPGTAAGGSAFATNSAGAVGVALAYPANTSVKVDGEAKVSFAGTAELAPSNCAIRLQVQVNVSS
jgi:hypothetical protein